MLHTHTKYAVGILCAEYTGVSRYSFQAHAFPILSIHFDYTDPELPKLLSWSNYIGFLPSIDENRYFWIEKCALVRFGYFWHKEDSSTWLSVKPCNEPTKNYRWKNMLNHQFPLHFH